ncbi:MAG: Polypeptide-transport-associated domain protein FtsQ-type [Streptosporangiaceae bacterium]|jgi:cell division protein FtsQ|nr:Polypeptide-transport-associated domain protein FtsQ-type [Streptosporangiaceae bacterium]
MADTDTTAGITRPEASGRPARALTLARRLPRRWKAVGMALVVAGVLGTAAWVLLGSRLLVVRHVEVTGVKLIPRDRVVAVARVPLGTPMVRLHTGAVGARVAGLQEVESVRVQRRWPATVRLAVTERVPLVVVGRGNRYYQMDRDGVIVITTSRRPPGLPAMVVANPSPADPATAAALKVRGALPPRFARRLASIEAGSPEAVTLRFKAGMTVVWGAAERAGEKIRLIDALLATQAGRSARKIDISSPEVVTTR